MFLDLQEIAPQSLPVRCVPALAYLTALHSSGSEHGQNTGTKIFKSYKTCDQSCLLEKNTLVLHVLGLCSGAHTVVDQSSQKVVVTPCGAGGLKPNFMAALHIHVECSFVQILKSTRACFWSFLVRGSAAFWSSSFPELFNSFDCFAATSEVRWYHYACAHWYHMQKFPCRYMYQNVIFYPISNL